ncbi:DUF6247 family protein [Actinomycetospora succinea]|nr:DUF6247 family protein [Actinomycetospora succinea]
MTATYSIDDEPAGGHPLRQGASPAAIHAALPPEDRADFDADYAKALDRAGTTRDLTELFTVLEHWRRLAVLQSEPEIFRRVAERAAELRTDEPATEDPAAEAQADPGR